MFDSYADIFAERGAAYHKAMLAYPRARDAEFLAMIEPTAMREIASLCDMPSGGGYLASYLPKSWRYTAVEPTDAFGTGSREDIEHEILRCSLSSVPKPDSTYDCIVSLAGLHHEHDKRLILEEIARLLRPGGIAIIADVAEGSPQDLFLNGFVDANSEMGHRGEFLDGDFAQLIQHTGMHVEADAPVETPWTFADRLDAARFAKSLFGVSAPLQDVEKALDETVGLHEAAGTVSICWALRRLVCVL